MDKMIIFYRCMQKMSRINIFLIFKGIRWSKDLVYIYIYIYINLDRHALLHYL
jgi:hypothetical protein